MVVVSSGSRSHRCRSTVLLRYGLDDPGQQPVRAWFENFTRARAGAPRSPEGPQMRSWEWLSTVWRITGTLESSRTPKVSVLGMQLVSPARPGKHAKHAGLELPVKEPNCTLALSEPLGTEWCLPVACGYHRKIQTNGNHVSLLFIKQLKVSSKTGSAVGKVYKNPWHKK